MSASVRFILNFLILFSTFYGFNIGYIAITSPGGLYCSFLDEHCNYIALWRNLYITTAANILKSMDYKVYTTATTLKIEGYAGFRLVYSCLGYGVISCFSAFVLSYPKPFRSKGIFLLTGLAIIISLNLCRFIFLPIIYHPGVGILSVNHHDIFNGMLYLVILLICYKWMNSGKAYT